MWARIIHAHSWVHICDAVVISIRVTNQPNHITVVISYALVSREGLANWSSSYFFQNLMTPDVLLQEVFSTWRHVAPLQDFVNHHPSALIHFWIGTSTCRILRKYLPDLLDIVVWYIHFVVWFSRESPNSTRNTRHDLGCAWPWVAGWQRGCFLPTTSLTSQSTMWNIYDFSANLWKFGFQRILPRTLPGLTSGSIIIIGDYLITEGLH